MSSIMLSSAATAFRALGVYRLRTLLSVLGIAVGIVAIVVIMSAGESLKQIFFDQVSSFGTDYIQVEIKVPTSSKNSTGNAAGLAQGISITTLSLQDKQDIDLLPNVRTSYAAVTGQASVRSDSAERRYNYFAVSHEFVSIDRGELLRGRFFTKEEDDGLARVVVLGSEAAKYLFSGLDAVGRSIKIQNTTFRVIGVFEPRGSVGFFDMDSFLYIPLHTAQKLLLGFDHILMIFVQIADVSRDRETAQDITSVVRSNHEITDPSREDFAVTTQEEATELLSSILDAVTLIISVIASIALIVGGVGIMNIMYVAVSERIFEIGLRKAVGATSSHIRWQFLAEAAFITVAGGIAGIVVAVFVLVFVDLLASRQGFSWPLVISPLAVVLSLVFSSAVGLVFGYFPAQKASRMHPARALTETVA